MVPTVIINFSNTNQIFAYYSQGPDAFHRRIIDNMSLNKALKYIDVLKKKQK